MKRNWVPDNIVNALASAMLIFGATELIKPEAGLLSVTIAGLIVGIKNHVSFAKLKPLKLKLWIF